MTLPHPLDRRRTPRAVAALLAVVLAATAALVGAPPAPTAAAVPVGLTWKMSVHAFTSTSLMPAHATAAPATKTTDGFVFPTVTSAQYNADTGAARVAYSGSFDLGNLTQGNYRIRVANPIVIVNADDTGRVEATVSYALFTGGVHVWSTPIAVDVATFTIPDANVVEDGTNVSFTVTPDFVLRTDNPTNPAWRRFPLSFMNALAPATPSLLGHFQETGSATSDGNKVPAPLTVSFDASPATIAVTGLEQTYDGTPKPVTVTTDPSGLDTVVTYDGEATVPTAAGTYAVSVTLDEELTSALPFSGTLTIAKAAQTIAFDPLPERREDDEPFTVAPTATSSLAVNVAAEGACSADGNEVTIDSAGECTVTATQAGDDNWEAAPPVAQTFTVISLDEVFVRRAYQVVLGRAPDTGGRGHWLAALDGDVSRATMADALARSGEAQRRVVDGAYLAVFDRPADTAGRAYWAGRLAAGLTAADLMAHLLASTETHLRTETDPEILAGLFYQAYLGRAGDLPGVAYWTGRLAATDDTAGRHLVALAFGATSEVTTVGVRTALVRACGSDSLGSSTVTERWASSGHHPLRTAATALSALCPTTEPV